MFRECILLCFLKLLKSLGIFKSTSKQVLSPHYPEILKTMFSSYTTGVTLSMAVLVWSALHSEICYQVFNGFSQMISPTNFDKTQTTFPPEPPALALSVLPKAPSNRDKIKNILILANRHFSDDGDQIVYFPMAYAR